MGSLRRSLKRKFERENRKNDMRAVWNKLENSSEYVYRRLAEEQRTHMIDEDNRNMTIAMYYLFGIALHEVYGFGEQRIMRVYNAIDTELGLWRAGETTIESLHDKLKNTVNIDIDVH